MSEAPVVEDEVFEEELPAEPVHAKAPVKVLLPIIRVGDWVRLAGTKGVPPHLVNSVAMVTDASVLRSDGQDSMSDRPYEYQTADAIFNVRVRGTGDVLTNLVRKDFVSHGPTETNVSRHAVSR